MVILMIDEKQLLEILKSREDRAKKQMDILSIYPYSLISFTLNIPGIIKDSNQYRKIHKAGMEEIIDYLERIQSELKYIEEINKITGSEGYLSVNMDSSILKELMVEIENTHPLGRIFDIDVFDKYHNQMSRSDLGLESRKCLICNKDARVCMREKNHSYEELISRIEKINREYLR